MKAIKNVLSGRGLPKRGDKGFTLVELLIVLAILAVLAAVVIPNIFGMLGRGAENAYDTDKKTITASAASFYFDLHKGPITGDWSDTTGVSDHWYPTTSGNPTDLVVDAAGAVVTDAAAPAIDTDIQAAAIWMGLLVNEANAGGTGTADRALAAPQTGEKGPYLNEFAQSSTDEISATVEGNGNPAGTPGHYTWIVLKGGRIAGVYWDADLTVPAWMDGFSGTYP